MGSSNDVSTQFVVYSFVDISIDVNGTLLMMVSAMNDLKSSYCLQRTSLFMSGDLAMYVLRVLCVSSRYVRRVACKYVWKTSGKIKLLGRGDYYCNE